MNFVRTGPAQRDLARRNFVLMDPVQRDLVHRRFVHEGMDVLVSAPQLPRN